MNITPLTYLSCIIFVLNLFLHCDDVSYRTKTNPCIKIAINLINNAWMTDIDRAFFGPQMKKIKYFIIIYGQFQVIQCLMKITCEHRTLSYMFLVICVSQTRYIWTLNIFYLFTLWNLYLYVNHCKKTFHLCCWFYILVILNLIIVGFLVWFNYYPCSKNSMQAVPERLGEIKTPI